MKPIAYTRHAKNRMRLHKISAEDVERTLISPDFKESSIKMRINLWKKLSGKFLRITCREETTRIVIVSAVLKKKPTKGVEL